jgi:predicted SAM-dependent methyltransferase
MKLDLGCGRRPAPGYVGVDLHESADIQGSLLQVDLPDGVATDIYSSHSLEHVRKAEVIPVLREWHRLLQPGGKLILRVPDLEWCILNWIQSGKRNGWELDTIFGSQEHEGNVHRTGFTPDMLRFYLSVAGFIVDHMQIIQSHGQPTIEVFAHKEQ